jgi:hypothetical protein
MPIDSGQYCQYCVDESGNLQPFEERLERMTQWMRRQNPERAGEELEKAALDYMAKMPAWRDHPSLLARLNAE